MILRFCSGSVTPGERDRGTAPTRRRTPAAACSRSKRRRICPASSSRITPLSTKMQVRRSPIALWISSAATVESTPPLRPQTDAAVPHLLAGSRSTVSCTNDAIVQSPVQPQTSKAKLREDVECRGRCARLQGGRAARRTGDPRPTIAATGALALVAVTAKPGGGGLHEVAVARPYPQLAPGPRRRAARPARPSIVARPNSRCGAGATFAAEGVRSSAACRSRCRAPARRR